MKSKGDLPLSRQISSDLAIGLLSTLAAVVFFAGALFLQWLIYDDWLHDAGPVRIVGSLLAALLAFATVSYRMRASRRRKLELLRRFEAIRWMNDRIRNALQAIECVTFASNPDATAPVRTAVEMIEGVLNEVLADSGSAPRLTSPDRPEAARRAQYQAQ